MAQGHWLALFGAGFGLWFLLFLMSLPEANALPSGLGFIEAICSVTPGTAGYPAAFAMWLLMSAAMMAPTALPAFATYDDLPGTDPRGLSRLLSGYLVIWAGFAALTAALQSAFVNADLIGTFGQSRSVWLTAALFAVAGLYQFSALKDACLSRCRAPLAFFMSHWDEGALKNGLRLGADCLGCCWALMLLLFVGGVMNLLVIAAITIFVLLEKVAPGGRTLGRAGAVLLAVAGIALLAGV